MRITSAPPRSAPRTVRLRRRPSRRLLLGGLVLLLAVSTAGIFLSSAILHPAHAAPTRWGADPARMQSAVTAAGWPQQAHIWCGVAAVAAVAQYRGVAATQPSVDGLLNSAALNSAWGVPGPASDAYGPGFAADISRDAGLDPRGHAAALAHSTGSPYHQVVSYSGSWTATRHLVADLLRTQEPIAVIVDHGAHTVLVAGVYAYGDPNNLNNVASVEVWDPGVDSVDGGVQYQRELTVSLNTWLYSGSYWGWTYQQNIYDGRHALDPDPSVGPYTYDPSQGRNVHLWVGHFVYIRPDRSGDAAFGVSPDWAFNQDGALIRGFSGEVPAGYGGPSVPMYVPPPPPPTPRPPTPTPTNTPRPTATPHQPRPPTDVPDYPTAAAPPAGAQQSTPAPGSLFGFSLQTVCLGAACAGPQVVAMVALGGASSLGATILLLVGVVMLRRRRKAARERAPGASHETTPPVTRQPANEDERASATISQEGHDAADSVAQGSADVPAGVPADVPGDAPVPAVDAATSMPGADTGAASGLPAETGPLARLARASDRLVQLAETTGAAHASDDPPALDAAPRDVTDAANVAETADASAPAAGSATAEPVSGAAAGDAAPDTPSA